MRGAGAGLGGVVERWRIFLISFCLQLQTNKLDAGVSSVRALSARHVWILERPTRAEEIGEKYLWDLKRKKKMTSSVSCDDDLGHMLVNQYLRSTFWLVWRCWESDDKLLASYRWWIFDSDHYKLLTSPSCRNRNLVYSVVGNIWKGNGCMSIMRGEGR